LLYLPKTKKRKKEREIKKDLEPGQRETEVPREPVERELLR
jgi:hypothetical protein